MRTLREMEILVVMKMTRIEISVMGAFWVYIHEFHCTASTHIPSYISFR